MHNLAQSSTTPMHRGWIRNFYPIAARSEDVTPQGASDSGGTAAGGKGHPFAAGTGASNSPFQGLRHEVGRSIPRERAPITFNDETSRESGRRNSPSRTSRSRDRSTCVAATEIHGIWAYSPARPAHDAG